MKKVLVVWYKNFEYLESIKNAFLANGITADKFVVEYFSDYASVVERLSNNFGISYFRQQHNKQMRNAIIAKCEQEQFDHILILTGNFVEVLDKEFFVWANNTKRILSLWFIDSVRKFDCFSKEYFQNFKQIYSFEPLDIEYLLEKYAVEGVKYLPLGAAEELYNDKQPRQKEYDICFVGVGGEKRAEILEEVAKYCAANDKKMVVYGQFWRFRPWIHRMRHERKFKKKYPNLYKVVNNRFIRPEKVAELYKKSRICLNIVQAVHSAANPRTFEILATRSFQLVDYNPTIEMLLTNGEHLVMYKDKADAVSLIDFYLKNDATREKIAKAGFEEIQANFLLKKIVGSVEK